MDHAHLSLSVVFSRTLSSVLHVFVSVFSLWSAQRNNIFENCVVLESFPTQKALASGAPPQAPIGELTALLHTPWEVGHPSRTLPGVAPPIGLPLPFRRIRYCYIYPCSSIFQHLQRKIVVCGPVPVLGQ